MQTEAPRHSFRLERQPACHQLLRWCAELTRSLSFSFGITAVSLIGCWAPQMRKLTVLKCHLLRAKMLNGNAGFVHLHLRAPELNGTVLFSQTRKILESGATTSFVTSPNSTSLSRWVCKPLRICGFSYPSNFISPSFYFL